MVELSTNPGKPVGYIPVYPAPYTAPPPIPTPFPPSGRCYDVFTPVLLWYIPRNTQPVYAVAFAFNIYQVVLKLPRLPTRKKYVTKPLGDVTVLDYILERQSQLFSKTTGGIRSRLIHTVLEPVCETSYVLFRSAFSSYTPTAISGSPTLIAELISSGTARPEEIAPNVKYTMSMVHVNIITNVNELLAYLNTIFGGGVTLVGETGSQSTSTESKELGGA